MTKGILRNSGATVLVLLLFLGARQAPEWQTTGIGKAYVTSRIPQGLTAGRDLSARDRRENFDALFGAIDAEYADFKLKHIDWADVGRRYRARLDSVQSDDDFYLLLFRLVNELKDTHSWLVNYKVPAPDAATDLTLDLFAGRPYVVEVKPGSTAAVVRPGWEVVGVDGMTVAEKMEALRARLHACSSDRAFQRQAVRNLLAGESGTTATVILRSPDGGTLTVDLRRTPGPPSRLPGRPVAFELTRQRYVHFGRHPSGLGYIWITSFDGRDQIVEEFDRALEQLRDTPGLILDIRDNTGGYGQPKIVGRLLSKRSLTTVAYIRSERGRDGMDRHDEYLGPSGPWQYTQPIALLVNDVTGSAADLFACELRSAGRVITVGSTTHGNLSGTAVYAVLPCGLVVRISNGYLADAKGRPIEVNGNVPDIPVEPGIEDFLNRRDPVMEQAVNALMPRVHAAPRGRSVQQRAPTDGSRSPAGACAGAGRALPD